jgi:hypothetical protein
MMYKTAATGLLALLHFALPVTGSVETEIVVNPGKYGPYYHMRFELRAEGIDFRRSDDAVRSGGQFEIRLRPEHFPVAAPNCRGLLILRMPWTAPQTSGAAEKIAAKEKLLARISALEHAPEAAVPVTVELNPYVEIVSRKPLKARLTQCNVFFRHASGAYIDHAGPLTEN